MKSLMRHVLTMLLFVVLTIVGNILSKQIAMGMMSIYDEGELTHWEKLDATFIFEEILDATPNEILAKSSDGETYSWTSSIAVCQTAEIECNRWVKDDNGLMYPSDYYAPLNSNLDTCIGLSDKFKSFKDPSGEIYICYFTTAEEWTRNNDGSYYALLKDGSIWSWSNTGETSSVNYYLIVLVGFLLSTVTFILIMISSKNAGLRRTNIQVMKNLLLLFFLSVGGIFGGYIIGGYIVDLHTSGKFTSWELLDGPYKFEEIVDANSSTVWAKTADGKLYLWNCQSQDECKWVEVENVPDNTHENDQGVGEQPLNKGDTCPSDISFSPSKEPPGKIVECALGWYWSIDAGFGGYFALLEDGTIWSWRHTYDVFNATMFFIPLSACGGLIISIVIFIVIMIIVARNSRKRASKIEKELL